MLAKSNRRNLVEVPEGILIDIEAVGCDDAARRVFDEANVTDVNEMKDLVEAYKSQNTFLNHEVVGLCSIFFSFKSVDYCNSTKLDQ